MQVRSKPNAPFCRSCHPHAVRSGCRQIRTRLNAAFLWGLLLPSILPHRSFELAPATNPAPGQPAVMPWVSCRPTARPKWLQMVLSRNFGAIALVNACMFMTQNGARAVLMPLLAIQGCGLSPKTLGEPA